MIGQDRIHQAWPWGRIVHEEYFKNKKHYNRLVGYFGKAGYFHKGKKHQVILPDYFKTEYFRGKRIARFYSARRSGGDIARSTPKEKEPQPSETVTGRKLATCGQMTLLFYRPKYDWTGIFPSHELILFDELCMPYKDFVNQCPGEYVKGLGYSFHLSGAPPVPCPF